MKSEYSGKTHMTNDKVFQLYSADLTIFVSVYLCDNLSNVFFWDFVALAEFCENLIHKVLKLARTKVSVFVRIEVVKAHAYCVPTCLFHHLGVA
jgi:hypothetical protein